MRLQLMGMPSPLTLRQIGLAWVLSGAVPAAMAVTFPPNHADFLYHTYDGDGTTVSGTTVLVHKAVRPDTAVSAHYSADAISSASIQTTAGDYIDRRNEIGFDVEYGHSAAIANVGFSSVQEDDFSARTFDFDISQDALKGLATLHLGGGRAWDTINKKGTKFEDEATHYHYRLGLTGIVTPTTLINLDYEVQSDNGYLTNPYFSARILGATIEEKKPEVRTSQALAVRLAQSFTPRLSLAADYRYFWDSWHINAHTLDSRISFQLGPRWLTELKARLYTQTEAAFYSDNFAEPLNFMSRDKQLSRFSSYGLGLKVQLEMFGKLWRLQRGTFSVGYDHMVVEYENFTDITTNAPHNFTAGIFQTMISVWY